MQPPKTFGTTKHHQNTTKNTTETPPKHLRDTARTPPEFPLLYTTFLFAPFFPPILSGPKQKKKPTGHRRPMSRIGSFSSEAPPGPRTELVSFALREVLDSTPNHLFFLWVLYALKRLAAPLLKQVLLPVVAAKVTACLGAAHMLLPTVANRLEANKLHDLPRRVLLAQASRLICDLAMPRQSSRSSASAPQRAAPAPSHGRAAPAAAPARQAPPAAQHAPPPAAAAPAAPPAAAPAGGGMMSGLMGSMVSGMATGTGMAVANRAVDAVMGPRQTEVVHRHEGAPAAPAASSQPTCQFQQDQLSQCMKSSSDASSCQSYMDALKACQQGQ